jgi:hypothetical protein
MDDDDRLKPLLSNMSKHYLSAEYEAGKNMSAAGTVTHNDVDKVNVPNGRVNFNMRLLL